MITTDKSKPQEAQAVEAQERVSLPLSSIRPYPNNPRRNAEAIPYVMECIKKFGFREANAIELDADHTIICGHTRYEAAKALGLESVPCVIARDLTPEQVRARRVADNRSSELALWDLEKLDEELAQLEHEGFELGFGDLLLPDTPFEDTVFSPEEAPDRPETLLKEEAPDDRPETLLKAVFGLSLVFPVEYREQLYALIKERGKEQMGLEICRLLFGA